MPMMAGARSTMLEYASLTVILSKVADMATRKGLVAAEPVATLRSFPAMHAALIQQRHCGRGRAGRGRASLQFTQAPVARLIDDSPYEGEHFHYAAAVGASNNRLTRAIDLTEVESASLDFKIWHDLPSKRNTRMLR